MFWVCISDIFLKSVYSSRNLSQEMAKRAISQENRRTLSGSHSKIKSDIWDVCMLDACDGEDEVQSRRFLCQLLFPAMVEGGSGVTSVLLRIFFYTECGHKDVERAYTLWTLLSLTSFIFLIKSYTQYRPSAIIESVKITKYDYIRY